MEQHIAHNLSVVLERIHTASLRCGREAREVRLLLATKTVSAENIKIALRAGQTLIGENKVQEIKAKHEALKEVPHRTHFIGHLQSNKIKDVLKYDVDCIETVDRLDLAEKLHQRLSAAGRQLDILIQVNTSNEESKFGVAPKAALELVRQAAKLDSLRIKGLMTIGLFSAEAEKVRKCFKLLKHIQQEILALGLPSVEMKELSMGMSGDLEIAIEEGATIVRVGTAIFGQRIHPDSYYWDETKQVAG